MSGNLYYRFWVKWEFTMAYIKVHWTLWKSVLGGYFLSPLPVTILVFHMQPTFLKLLLKDITSETHWRGKVVNLEAKSCIFKFSWMLVHQYWWPTADPVPPCSRCWHLTSVTVAAQWSLVCTAIPCTAQRTMVTALHCTKFRHFTLHCTVLHYKHTVQCNFPALDPSQWPPKAATYLLSFTAAAQ